ADLAFILDARGGGRKHNRLAGGNQRAGRLEEEHRPLGKRVAQFLGMGHVVAAYTDDLGRTSVLHTLAPIPCLAKKSSHRVRTCAQVPTTCSARGSPPSTSGP